MTTRQDPARTAPSDGGHDPASVSMVTGLIVLVMGLSIALPLFLVASVPDADRSNGWMITLVVMAWSGFRLAELCVRGEPRLFNLFFWLFCYIFMGLAPSVQIRANQPSTTTPGVDPTLDVRTALIVLAGIVCFEIGSLLAGSTTRHRHGRPPARTPPVNAKVHGGRTALLVIVGSTITTLFIIKVGPGALLSDRAAAGAARLAAWPDPAVRALVYGSAVYPLLVAAGALAQLRRRTSPNWRVFGWIGLVVATLLLAIAVNPLGSARYNFGTVAFALAVYFGAVRTRTRVRWTVLAALFGFLFVFPLADLFRYSGSAATNVRTGFFEEYLGNPDYDGFWQISNADVVWRTGDLTPLRQLSGSLFFWVPRSLWADKPMDTGPLLAQSRGYTIQNLSAPMWAEAMVNGGWIALVVVFLALGYALHRMDDRLATALAAGGAWAIAGAVLPVYMTILLRGSWLQATGALVITAACIIFVADRTHASPDRRAGPARYPPSN